MRKFADHFAKQFQGWVETRPDHPAVAFVEDFDGGCGGPRLTYGELDARARALAGGLVARELTGERVLLLHPTGLDFAVAILGCFLSGAVGTPAPLPESSGRGDARLTGIVADAGVRHVLTSPDARPAVADWLTRAGLLDRVSVHVESELAEPGGSLPAPDPSALAFLQYTSGSTSDPKGVLVTHAALAHNEAQIIRAMDVDEHTRSVSWLPHYHDMGLVGQLLGPLFCGGTSYLMSPMAFLRHPHRWLKAVSELRGTVTVAPDFGYALVTRRTTDRQLAELDLSGLRVALNGSEPIHAATLERFVERFAPAGLDPAALTPCYGMAETTLLVSSTPAGSGFRALDVAAGALADHRLVPGTAGDRTTRLVGSGRVADFDLRVVDPDTSRELPEGHVGEIWVSGGSVAAGYHDNKEATEATFAARLADGEGPFLRTGDLGALLDGELYVTGRRKEMLIVNGRNLYPQDLELTVRTADPLFHEGATAVFTAPVAPGGGEAVVAVQEARPGRLRDQDPRTMVAATRRALLAEHDVHLGAMVLVPVGAVERTTSGKIRRGAMRERFLADELRALFHTQRPTSGDAGNNTAARTGTTAGAR
ncbi:fatty acyl-AMP ligase [Streptomyces durbertensis]|uniref:Fatty acyl-AMP ligase n=1 Tax=Streptomyces durbertensis TaxID=2448886 RepID=A0ABR6EDS8_9ACTN|nr:fatty acyl-AMP ligase [Streptomyces durbertensis]MBB1242654.1 fatty acyl-AMP ligase [Streptomyces durbertensis]